MAYKVLVIENEEAWQRRLERVFANDLSYEVTIAHEYGVAIRALQEAEPAFDLVTVDMSLESSAGDGDDVWQEEGRKAEADKLGLSILDYLLGQHRGEQCVIISGSEFTADYFTRFRKYDPILVQNFSKQDSELRAQLLSQIPAILAKRTWQPDQIFVSYRRDDSIYVTGFIYEGLAKHFGEDTVFRDLDAIPLGVDFEKRIEAVTEKCSVLLVVIGKSWISIQDDSGMRRLDKRDDYVRQEIEAALRRGIPVIPLLIEGASMPDENSLPTGLKELAKHNGTVIRPAPDFNLDMGRLAKALEQYVK